MQRRNRRLEFDVLEDRLALSLLAGSANDQPPIVPTVDAGPPITVQPYQQTGSALQLTGSFVDPEINVNDYASGAFYLRRASDGGLVEDGGASVDSLRRTLNYTLVVPAPGTYTLELDLTYNNTTGSGQTTLTVLSSTPPGTPQVIPIVDAGPDTTVYEGQQPNIIPMQGSFSDPNATPESYLPAVFYVRREGDGSLVEDGGVSVNLQTHALNYDVVQVPPGDYVIAVQLTDGSLTGTGTTYLNVLPNPLPPAAPQVVPPANGNITEGGTFRGVYSFTDSGAGPWTVKVDLGNGLPPLTLSPVMQPEGFSLGAVYFQDSAEQPGGVFHGSVTVTDAATGLTGSASFTVLVHDAAPIVDAGPDVTVTEGAQPNVIPLSGSFSDPGPTENWSALFTVRRQDGSFVEDGGVFVDPASKTLKYSAVQLTPGLYTVTLAVNDGDASGSAVTHLTVLPNPVPHAPVVVAPANAVINEGGTYNGTYSFSDPDGGPWTVSVNLGTGGAPLVLTNVKQPGSFNLAALYSNDSANQPGGVFHGSVTVTDSTGLSGSAAFTVLVHEVAPVLHVPPALVMHTTPWPWWWRSAYQPVTISYSDPAPAGVLSASFTVRNQHGKVVEAGFGYVNSASHTARFYLRDLPAGRYTVSFTLTDDGSAGYAQTTLAVVPSWRLRYADYFFAWYERNRHCFYPYCA
jgi:hypothetical protein